MMTMIKEDVISAGNLTSNVPITETEWAAGTYVNGDRRYLPGTFDLYEVTAETTTDSPLVGDAREPKTWVKIGKVNRWRMFSEFIAEQTTSPSPIIIELDVPLTTNAVAVFGIDAEEVEVATSSNGVETSRVTRSLANAMEVDNWYDYFFQPIVTLSEGVILNLPSFGTDRILITIRSDAGPVAVGKLVVGAAMPLGTTDMDFTTGLDFFGYREQDEFGGWTVVEGRFSKPGEFTVYMDVVQVPNIIRELAAVRARPTVYIGDINVPESVVIGFYKEVRVRRLGPTISQMKLAIEGLT